MFADHPITGIGLGNYKINYAPYEADFSLTQRGQGYDVSVDRVSQAHSELVQVGTELGSVGLFMLLCSLATLAASVWVRLRRISSHNRLDLVLLAAGILAILIHSLVSFPAHVASSSLELVVFCGLALSQIRRIDVILLDTQGMASQGSTRDSCPYCHPRHGLRSW